MRRLSVASLALFIATPAMSQESAVYAHDQGTARQLVEHLYPDWRRAKTIDSMSKALVAQELQANEGLRNAFGVMNFDIGVRKSDHYSKLREDFSQKLNLSAQKIVSENFAIFLDVLATEYATSLTAQQMGEIDQFISSSAGAAYVRASDDAGASPTLLKWQSGLRDAYRVSVNSDLEWLRTESRALSSKGKSHD